VKLDNSRERRRIKPGGIIRYRGTAARMKLEKHNNPQIDLGRKPLSGGGTIGKVVTCTTEVGWQAQGPICSTRKKSSKKLYHLTREVLFVELRESRENQKR